jgi:tetratricopeptide (TPR) repeat protein
MLTVTSEYERKKGAVDVFRAAYDAQMRSDFDEAVRLYGISIETFPTAEAHTYLGWTYSFLGRIDDAIVECKKAIELDPEFGNPYNDIGSYLMKQGKLDEAIPWLERALAAPRIEPRHYSHCTLGRAYWSKGMLIRAEQEFEKALALSPAYAYARNALETLRQHLH